MSFDQFWAVYPRRCAKLDAKKAYDKALKFATETEILLGAERYALIKAGTDPQFIKYPIGGWLRVRIMGRRVSSASAVWLRSP